VIDIALKVSREALDEIHDAKRALDGDPEREQVIDVLTGAGAHLRIVIAHLEEECLPEPTA
jgi:hypothetical protein